jgi:FkbM family methyltransferase
MDDGISAHCLAFNDVSGLDTFYMENTEVGGALNSFAEPINCHGEPFKASLKQAMIGFSIDDFIKQFNSPFPNHIKIDVDGIEDKIINGAKNTLSDKRLKSLLVELDSDRKQYTNGVIKLIEDTGLKFYIKKHCPRFDAGPYASIYNYIFVRS